MAEEGGEPVAVGEPLVELETDKVDLEVGAEQAGVLARIEQQQGEDVKVGDVLGTIEDGGASSQRPRREPATTATAATAAAAPRSRREGSGRAAGARSSRAKRRSAGAAPARRGAGCAS